MRGGGCNMPEYRIKFYGKNGDSEVNGAASTCGNNDVELHIPRIMAHSEASGVSFEKMFSECISHEIIHSLLKQNISHDAYFNFDKICSEKQVSILGSINFKMWYGGIPWWRRQHA